MYIPGLLQTRAYAEAVHRASEVQCPEREVQHMVDIRMKRQELLERDEPPHLWCVIDEAALRRRVGGRETMQSQLAHLLTMSQRPRITIQVLPFSTGAHAAAVGSFAVLRGPAPELDVVYVDLIGGGLFMEKRQELERYRLAFEYLSAQALDLESSAETIHRISKEL
jgi:hypothetical protein